MPANTIGCPIDRAVAQIDQEWLLTPERAVIHVPTSTAVVADLHLAYSQVRCQNGDAVPVTSFEEQLAPLSTLFASHEVAGLVVAGDLVEESQGNRIALFFQEWLHNQSVGLLGIVPGNHDGSIDSNVAVPMFPSGFRLGGWLVIHGDGRLPKTRTVCGHIHPCLRFGRLNAPCFLFRANRLILPAFTHDAAGGNVWNSRRWRGYHCYAIAGAKVLDFGQL